MQVNGRHNVDELLARMEEVRGRLDCDMRAARQSVHDMTDWRSVVRNYPLASVAVAAVAGFILVPKKQSRPTLSAEDLKRLSKDQPIIVTKEATPSPGLMGTVTAFAGAALARAVTSFVATKVSEFAVFKDREER